MAPRAAERHGWRPLLEPVLPLIAGVGSFAVTAVIGTAARTRVPEVLFGFLLLVGVAVLARVVGILFALPVGVAAVLAFDWYFLPPLRALDGNTVLVLGTFLIISVLVGEAATRASRRAISSERARGALATEQGALRRVATLVARQSTPGKSSGRWARLEVRGFAEEQAALRRVATLVAAGASRKRCSPRSPRDRAAWSALPRPSAGELGGATRGTTRSGRSRGRPRRWTGKPVGCSIGRAGRPR
jgi:K+-sensing histidine kinase KdpD